MKRLNITIILLIIVCIPCRAQSILDKQKTLNKFSFWSNEDWKWYKQNIPFLETPDIEIDKTYYYRWELVTMHLIYGSPKSGYASTEFIDRPWWAGAYGTISCPVGHQLYDYRWLKDPKYFKDYSKFWYKDPGAQLQNYTNWLGDAIWQGYKVHRDFRFTTNLLNDLINDYKKWEKKYFIESEGMFAWDGMHDGMETNINSRQTPQWFDGAPGYRPTFNAYMWAHAHAIVNIAKLVNDQRTADEFEEKAKIIKNNFQSKNWDQKREFFFHRFQNNEVTANKKDTIKANTLTYEDGIYQGSKHGRELIGYVPWYFNMIDDTKEFSKSWKFLMDSSYFYANFGPTVLERNDPLFKISENCCVWSGNSWPFATSQTLKGLSNVLNNYKNNSTVTKKDFYKLFSIYTMTQRKNGKPYIAEALHPDTGSWSGHDKVGHSEHYYHSSYVDLVISDLLGIKPQEDDFIIIKPLIPSSWDYFILEDFQYHGNNMTLIWDKTGKKYNKGKGFHLISNGKKIISKKNIQDLKVKIPLKIKKSLKERSVNYAVNNSNDKYPLAIASFPGIVHPINKINDGQFWYLKPTTNQWSNMYSQEKQDWAGIDFGTNQNINMIKIYFVEDNFKIRAPSQYQVQFWSDGKWKKIKNAKYQFNYPRARKANTIWFDDITTKKIRVLLIPEKGFNIGISELETWGDAKFPIRFPINKTKKPLNVSASFTSKFDEVDFIADGDININKRWTAFESPNKSDWVTIEYAKKKNFNTAYIHFYKDELNISPPEKVTIEYWNGITWEKVTNQNSITDTFIGNALNIITFDNIFTSKIKLSMTHQTTKYSGIYEIEYLKK
ncbi:discoidin domain-containing protein [Zunongwangia atlantica]|uniref:F5/8 type C domain-containing protein n=1 Tax=Zunongwangia atlantica 22II14-10F7 TaxID=1185767 RepID=A0A1Y1T2E3_9FLAO|nr:discoidin domain-containing protein [Zunongwangia atlantica]ORL44784.1 hypothetical protein IIF7_14769 [Zunongwangia atlantica 22II14-10F7]